MNGHLRFATLILPLVFVCCVEVQAADYYVSMTGSDTTGTGTISAPFRTAARAVSAAPAGSRIIFRSGTYTGGLYIQRANLTLQSADGEWAVLSVPYNDVNIGHCIQVDPASTGLVIRRLELVGGNWYALQFLTTFNTTTRTGDINYFAVVEDCKIHDTGRDCIKLVTGVNDVTIRRCEIYNSGMYSGTGAQGINNVNGDRMLVQDCYIHDIRGAGVYAKGGPIGVILERNFVRDCEGGLMLGQGTGLEFFDAANTQLYENIDGIVRNNIIVRTSGNGIGLWGALRPQVYNNTLIDTASSSQAALFMVIGGPGSAPNVDATIRNNIIGVSGAGSRPLIHIAPGGHTGTLTLSNNRYYRPGGAGTFWDERTGWRSFTFAGWASFVGETGSSEGDPLLDANYRLQATSPCINTGIAVTAASEDFERNVRTGTYDIGADEVTTTSIISSVVASGISNSSATINWNTAIPGDQQVEYGTTTAYGASTVLNAERTLGHSQALTGLAAGTVYNYRVKSRDCTGKLFVSSNFTFTTTGGTTDTTPPVISSVAASGITSSAATITWTTNEASDTQVEYGLTTAYGSSTTLNTTKVTAHSQALTGLAASTTYNYRVKSRDAAGNLAVSGNFTFTTAPAPDTTPPVISSVAASSITSSGATITWTTNEASDTQVEYGLTTAYGSSTTLNTTKVTAHSQALSGLAASTTYNYRVKSRDTAGNLGVSGNFTFTTAAAPDTTPPVISSVAASGITSSAATITWTTNEASDTQVEYGLTTAYGSSTTLNTTKVTAHSQALSGLFASTTYNYRVKSRDAAGNLAVSSNFTFTTTAAPDTTPPVISSVAASGITTSGATITWTTNEASDTQVEYGLTTAYGSSTPLNTTKVTAHSQALTGLAASTTYSYRVKSRDTAGNLAVSANFTFTTGSVALPLAFASAPTATPNPCTTADTVQFIVSTSGGVQPVSYAWSFGDGTSAQGASVSHRYSVAGTYTAAVEAIDGAGTRISTTVTVSVRRFKQRRQATISRVSATMNYTADSRDTLAVSGTLSEPLAEGETSLSVEIAGQSYDFELNERGLGRSGNHTLQLKGTAFKLALKNVGLNKKLVETGVLNTQSTTGTVPLELSLGGSEWVYDGGTDTVLTARPGKSGKLRK
ncbi:MAG TPA: fibronectin type III domain-containing protein [Planctomycetota bacterium]|nr:fibronectin type III domain-containing protein [Planctomycetota bacterium]